MSDRDQSLAIAFLVKTSLEALVERIMAGDLVTSDSQVQTYRRWPVEGGTVVIYGGHAFTDQVAGVGGSMKRGIGRRVMAEKMKEIFETGRTRAVK